MNEITSYVLSVTAAGMLCGIAVAILDEKRPYFRIAKLLAGIILSITVIKPLTGFHIGNLDPILEGLNMEGTLAAEIGVQQSEEAIETIIKSKVEAYILDKAASLGVTLRVEVMLENGAVPRISGVRLAGQVSPYARTQLTRILRDDLGIVEEHQIWMS